MIKAIVKIAIAVLIANALWRVGSSYLSYYRFSDAVSEMALHVTTRTEGGLKDRVVELAAMYDEPIDADAIRIELDEHHLSIVANYNKAVAVLPGYEYQWPFTLKVERLFVEAPVAR